MKIAVVEVAYCDYCPFVRTDANETRYECLKMSHRMIAWLGNDPTPVPIWCPLDDKAEVMPGVVVCRLGDED